MHIDQWDWTVVMQRTDTETLQNSDVEETKWPLLEVADIVR